MKKKILLLFGILIVICLVAAKADAAAYLIPDAYDLNITLVNQRPDPVEPGEYVELRFKFENYGSDPAQDVRVELIPDYPFGLEPGESAKKSVGTIDSRYKGNVGAIVKYKLRVDDDAIAGENKIRLRYNVNSGGDPNARTELEEFVINVQSHYAILAIKSIKLEPEDVAPGGVSKLIISLENLANMNLENIRVKLNLLQTATTTTAIATQEYPFATIDSSDELVIEKLKGREEANLTFNIMAEPGAESNLYKLPILITYNDWLGTEYSSTNSIGVKIGDKPDLITNLDSQSFYTTGGSGDISIKLVNKGSSDIKFMYLTLTETDDYRVIGTDSEYIGKIDSDDYESSDFKISMKNKEKDVGLKVKLEYSDSNNKEYKETIAIPLKLYSGSEAKKYGLVQGGSPVGIIIVLIIVGGGLYLYQRKKKKSDKGIFDILKSKFQRKK